MNNATRLFFSTVLMLLIAPFHAQAGYYDAESAFFRGEYKTAQSECRRVLANKDASSDELGKTNYLLGRMARNGLGMPRDLPSAWQYYLRSSRWGEARGYYGMGLMLLKGEGVIRNRAEAEVQFSKALRGLQSEASAGDRIAQGLLARMCEKGYGVPTDRDRAAALYRSAAQNGNSTAQIALGLAALRRANRDTAAASHWFETAAKQNDPRAVALWGIALCNGWNGAADAAAGKRALERAAGQGDAIADTALGYLLSLKPDAESDMKQAVTHLERALADGRMKAASRLAFLLAQGSGVDKNVPRAITLYQDAAESGDAGAQAALGAIFAGSGELVAPDYAKALHWLRRAAEQGCGNAMRNLSVMYREGRGVTPSPFEAWRLLQEADLADKSDARALPGTIDIF